MNDQSSTANATQSEPRLCKMGCGFFGSGATGDCCSKCWRDLQKKKGKSTVMTGTTAPPRLTTTTTTEPMEVERLETTPVVTEATATATEAAAKNVTFEESPLEEMTLSTTTSTPKKKTKKSSYKNMMASMLTSSSPKDTEKEKEKLRHVTGGGAFSKIDKI